MLTRLDLRGLDGDLRSRLPRPHDSEAAPTDAVREILAEVRKRGDAAVREYTQRFDGVALDELTSRVAAIAEPLAGTEDDLLASDLFEVERSLREAVRRLAHARATRRD